MKLIITDLDNTLYDWVSFFANSFSAMIDELIPILDVEREELLDQFKRVHQSYHNSEQPFAVLELPCVQERFRGREASAVLDHLSPALRAFNAVRDECLQLYPGVLSTLQQLTKAGLLVVGHTESIAVNAFFRLRKLEIWQYLDRLYALRGRLLPHPIEGRGELHAPPAEYVELLPSSERKPNPDLLIDICQRHGVSPGEAMYVGDSLTRDMSMAKQAGVLAVWAKYGTEFDRSLWDILVRVTHWSDEDVAREAQLKKMYQDVQPDLTIQSFDEILAVTELQLPSRVAVR